MEILQWLFNAGMIVLGALIILGLGIQFFAWLGRIIENLSKIGSRRQSAAEIEARAQIRVLEIRIKQLQEASPPENANELRERLNDCQEKGRLALQQRDQAREELEKIRKGKDSTRSSDTKFKAAKVAFARLYHPDNIRVDGIDKIVRTEIFKEFWRELEAIEKAS